MGVGAHNTKSYNLKLRFAYKPRHPSLPSEFSVDFFTTDIAPSGYIQKPNLNFAERVSQPLGIS